MADFFKYCVCVFVFFFNDTATTEIYTLSLHDALPISQGAMGLSMLGVEFWNLILQGGNTDGHGRTGTNTDRHGHGSKVLNCGLGRLWSRVRLSGVAVGEGTDRTARSQTPACLRMASAMVFVHFSTVAGSRPSMSRRALGSVPE